MKIEKLGGLFRESVNKHIHDEWGYPIVTRGNIIYTDNIPGYITIENNAIVGAILYQIKDRECEIVVLYSLAESKGIGTNLINTVIEKAKEENCKRVWLITMNDNTHAIRYYQKRGFTLKAVHIDAFEVTKRLKNEPLVGTILGIDGIPIKHEFEFEIKL